MKFGEKGIKDRDEERERERLRTFFLYRKIIHRILRERGKIERERERESDT